MWEVENTASREISFSCQSKGRHWCCAPARSSRQRPVGQQQALPCPDPTPTAREPTLGASPSRATSRAPRACQSASRDRSRGRRGHRAPARSSRRRPVGPQQALSRPHSTPTAREPTHTDPLPVGVAATDHMLFLGHYLCDFADSLISADVRKVQLDVLPSSGCWIVRVHQPCWPLPQLLLVLPCAPRSVELGETIRGRARFSRSKSGRLSRGGHDAREPNAGESPQQIS